MRGEGGRTGHDGGGGVGAVGGDGDDAHVALLVAVGLVEGADGHEARVLPARPAVGLQRHRVEARDLRQLRGQVLQQGPPDASAMHGFQRTRCF